MKDHITDPGTGFLTPGPGFPGRGLTADQKKFFLKEYVKSFNLSKAAELASTDRRTVQQHLKEDRRFREAFEDVTERILDDVQESLFKQSQKSPIAVMQLLRAKRPDEWGGKRKQEPEDKTSAKLRALLEEN